MNTPLWYPNETYKFIVKNYHDWLDAYEYFEVVAHNGILTTDADKIVQHIANQYTQYHIEQNIRPNQNIYNHIYTHTIPMILDMLRTIIEDPFFNQTVVSPLKFNLDKIANDMPLELHDLYKRFDTVLARTEGVEPVIHASLVYKLRQDTRTYQREIRAQFMQACANNRTIYKHALTYLSNRLDVPGRTDNVQQHFAMRSILVNQNISVKDPTDIPQKVENMLKAINAPTLQERIQLLTSKIKNERNIHDILIGIYKDEGLDLSELMPRIENQMRIANISPLDYNKFIPNVLKNDLK